MTLLARSLLRALGETNRRRLASLVGLATVLTWLAVLPATACKESIDSMVGYRNAYGELLPERDEQAKRAHEIFQRLLDAARPQVTLRLLVTMTDDFTKPFACAIPDGSIILSKGVLQASYRDPARGDDLLAFVLAHEIAHHEKRDFWHRQFAQAIEASQADLTDPQQREGPQRLLDFVNQMDERLVKEAQADEFGIFYASLAGFNTYRLVFEDNKLAHV